MCMNELKAIQASLDELDRVIREERKEYNRELADRLKKGLTGAEGIKHYNEWMKRAGMAHLMVKE